MEYHARTRDHPKKRRRKLLRAPISARLIVDDHEIGNIGDISRDLFVDLFGRNARKVADDDPTEIHYVAVSTWQPLSTDLLEDAQWTILPIRAPAEEADITASTLRFPATSTASQRLLAGIDYGEHNLRAKSGLEILVLDVQPLALETIFVKVDGDALQKHEEVQRRFGGGFHTSQPNGEAKNGNGEAVTPEHVDGESREELLRLSIRRSFAESTVVHKGDFLPLPLPAHPITHVPFPPVKITACEPVDQGIVSGDAKIVLDITPHSLLLSHRTAIHARGKYVKGLLAQGEDDTSAEQFFSAIEPDEHSERQQEDVPNDTVTQSSTSDSSGSGDDTLSDDSLDNVISLSTPALPLYQSGIMSSISAATPRPFVRRPNGTSTPGSVFSNYTGTTARQGIKSSGRPFRVTPLLARVPDSILHPPPQSDEDDEARVFVDVKSLVRLACFSGDWVKVSRASVTTDVKENLAGAFEDEDSESSEFRVVKIYGLSGLSIEGSVENHKLNKFNSSTSRTARPIPMAYMSPILFANLGQPLRITISAVSSSQRFTKSKITSSSIPPIAKEITLLRLPTPLSTERAIQAGLLVGLKQYFERRRRILQKGDLIGIAMDIGISRILAETNTGDEQDHDLDELFTGCTERAGSKNGRMGVAWFKVGQVQTLSAKEDDGQGSEVWGDSASVEPLTTRMVQAGTEHGLVPAAMDNPWEMYLGIKNAPRPLLSNRTGVRSVEALHPSYTPPLRRRIRELLAAAISPQALHLDMKPIVLLLHSTQRNIGKAASIKSACADLGLHLFPIDAYDVLSEGGAGGGDVKTEASLRAKVERALTCGAEYTIPLIRHAEALTADRMASALKDLLKDLRALAMTTTELEKVPESVRSLVTHELEVSAPDEGERQGILQGIIDERGTKIAYDVDLSAVAVKTAALVAGDLIDVVDRALVARQDRLEKLSDSTGGCLVRDILVSGGTSTQCVIKADFDVAVDAARKNFADSIGAPKIPNVGWDDVGGLTNVKDAVMETIQLPLERPELFAKGMKKRSGILFYGPPGTGKTSLPPLPRVCRHISDTEQTPGQGDRDRIFLELLLC